MHALAFDRFGDPSVLSLRQLPDPVLKPGEALVRTQAIGLNFADVYRRRGNYHLAGEAPWILGYEAAGIIESINPGDTANGEPLPPLRVGDRVAFADVPRANAELVAAPLTHLVPVPDGVSSEEAAALLLQGLTAQYLIDDSHALAPGELSVVHAAAGGVGLLLVQLAVQRGATVLALASSPAKAERARAAGAQLTATYADDWVALARRSSRGGAGADVVFDSVGSTLQQSLAAVRTRGHVVFYGMSGGDPQPVDPRVLMDGSKSLTGGDLWNVLTSSAERVRRSSALFAQVASGALRLEISRRFPLAQGAEAHRFLESRASTGKVLLLTNP